MLRLFGLLFILLMGMSEGVAQTGQQLANYLGTGNNPRLQLTLSANGPGWGGFTIDYQGIGNVPWSSDASNDWSSWNVYDTASPPNWYGTITLLSNGSSVQWSSYTGGTGGYYLSGIHLDYNSGLAAYELTVDAIYPSGGGGGAGPFPDTPPATPAVYPGTTQSIFLQVSGDQIVNDKLESIWIKGLVRPSLEWSSTGQYLSTEDLSNIANWSSGGTVANSNVIRLDLYQGYWLDSAPATTIGSYKQIINAIVYYAVQLGMSVILDLHWTTYGSQSPMANQDSITFWQQVATDYQSFGTVMFELYNEPYGITTDVWLNGDGTYAGYQQLYDAVRGTGAQNICIIGGLDYAYDLSFVNESFGVSGYNIVYCSHPYDDKGQPGYTGEGGAFDQNYAGIIGRLPLIFTEFGTNSSSYYPNGYQTIYENILDYVNANQVHYSGFAWWVQDGNPQFPCLIEDWNGDALYGGINVHDDMVSNPGTPLAGGAVAFQSFHVVPGLAGTHSKFDASDFAGVSYCWHFGDASSDCTSTPVTKHVYAASGSYVVVLEVVRNGQVVHKNSKTIKVDTNPFRPCSLACPPRNVEGKQIVNGSRKTKDVITWEGSQSNKYCKKGAYFLVFRDLGLTDLVAKVKAKGRSNQYRAVVKGKKKGKTTYAIVAVDKNGNRSVPVTVTVGYGNRGKKRVKDQLNSSPSSSSSE